MKEPKKEPRDRRSRTSTVLTQCRRVLRVRVVVKVLRADSVVLAADVVGVAAVGVDPAVARAAGRTKAVEIASLFKE